MGVGTRVVAVQAGGGTAMMEAVGKDIAHISGICKTVKFIDGNVVPASYY